MFVTYGNDIEFHLLNTKRKKFVSAIPVLKNDKHSPIDLGDDIKVYADNILVETSFPPFSTKEEMMGRYRTVFGRIQNFLGKDYRLVPKAAHYYDESELLDEKALEIGCTENFNAWEVCVNPKIEFSNNLRTAGFHCHIGHEKLTDHETRIDAVRLVDTVLGTASVIFNKNEEGEVDRRNLYGQSSEHRPTSYGLEYRCLSPATLRSPLLAELVFDLINYCLDFSLNDKANDVLGVVDREKVIKAINTCDAKLAEEVLNEVKLPQEFMKRIKKSYNANFYKAWDIAT